MGFKAWRNLSVLLLAGAALIGCNNGPQKSKEVIATKGSPTGALPVGVGPGAPGAFPGGPVGAGNQFPTVKPTSNPNPYLPTSGAGQPNLNQGIQQPEIGGAPGRFAPMKDLGPPPNTSLNIPALPVQKTNGSFAEQRGDTRINLQPDLLPTGSVPAIPAPPGFDKR